MNQAPEINTPTVSRNGKRRTLSLMEQAFRKGVCDMGDRFEAIEFAAGIRATGVVVKVSRKGQCERVRITLEFTEAGLVPALLADLQPR